MDHNWLGWWQVMAGVGPLSLCQVEMCSPLCCVGDCLSANLPLICQHITLSPSPPLPLPPVLPAAPVGIEAISTTMTSAVLEVQLSPVGTPPLLVVLDLTSHPELGCCGNQTTFLRGGSVRFSLEGLSADTTYTVSVFVKNHAGQGVGKQQSFSTGQSSLLLQIFELFLTLCSLSLSLSLSPSLSLSLSLSRW